MIQVQAESLAYLEPSFKTTEWFTHDFVNLLASLQTGDCFERL